MTLLQELEARLAAALTAVQMLVGAGVVVNLRSDVRDDVMLMSWANLHVWGWRIGVIAAIGAITIEATAVVSLFSTTKSPASLMSLKEYLEGLMDTLNCGGLEHTTPHHAIVIIFELLAVLSRQLTNTTGTG